MDLSRPFQLNLGSSHLTSSHWLVGPSPPGHLLPARVRVCQGARAKWGQCPVTSMGTFKRLPLRALIARRAAAPEVAIVSPFSASSVHGRGMDLGPP